MCVCIHYLLWQGTVCACHFKGLELAATRCLTRAAILEARAAYINRAVWLLEARQQHRLAGELPKTTWRKDANAALLSNFEVFQLLTDLKQQRKESGKSKQSSGQQNLNTIMYETLKYISKTPCRYQSPEIVRDFLTAMKGHKLTKAEKLQLLNHRPVTAVEIQLFHGFPVPACMPPSIWYHARNK
ncbi:DNA-directed RNA polymerase III subunit RPC9 isoform X2 [Alligator mississippiensis]|uniref:DNA-directed RNA polymerase III subunit RPC9 isoform X2 n=1 Tax=Alligator mississippiensis TaxID=8496 RepID=UPI0028777C5D|nr:DNA-directed RNA polymerase III subunit RPC9 isoform X2 [Alligator mississippiensis]